MILTVIVRYRYDDLKTAQENIDLQSTILSRFDLIFIVKDERSIEKDQRIARWIMSPSHASGQCMKLSMSFFRCPTHYQLWPEAQR